MMNHRKARMGKSTDFGIPQVGKGDSERIADRESYNKNFDEIDWGRKPKTPPPEPTIYES